MDKKMKKFRCLNCGKTFEMPVTADDPVRCPYCGMGPGVLIRVDNEKEKVPPQPQIPSQIGQTTPLSPVGMKRFMCFNCHKIIEVPYGVPKPIKCPYCGAPHYMIHRIDGMRRRWGQRKRIWWRL